MRLVQTPVQDHRCRPGGPIIVLFASEVSGSVEYDLATGYVTWTSGHDTTRLTDDERGGVEAPDRPSQSAAGG